MQFSPCESTISTLACGAQGQYQSLMVVVLHVMPCTCASQIWPYVAEAPAGGACTVSCSFQRPFLQPMQTSLGRHRLHNTQTPPVQRHIYVVGFRQAGILQSQHCMTLCAPLPVITTRKRPCRYSGQYLCHMGWLVYVTQISLINRRINSPETEAFAFRRIVRAHILLRSCRRGT